MHGTKRLLAIAFVALAFAAGFGLATLLARGPTTASARGQADLYRQVLQDLERNYYRPVDVSRLGRAGIDGLLASLHDPYTVYFTAQQANAFRQELSGTYTGIGTAVDNKGGRLTVTEVFPGSPAALADIRPGEIIVTIGGVPTAGKPVNASVSRILGPAGTQVRLQLRRTGVAGLIDLTLTRRKISPPLTSSRLIDDHGTKVGYVSLSAFAQGAGAQVGRAVAALQKAGAQRLLFDLRNDGGGLVDEAVKVAGDFLPAGKVVATTRGLHQSKEVLRTSGAKPTSLPLVVLVNGNTASASEIVTGALQDYRRATVIGTRTFGKGVVQVVLPLRGGASLKITIAAYLTPLGRNINHRGIEPSIVVVQKPPGHADAGLARALRFIAGGR
ncbi:MAG: S41 family peptidase [Thermoleophilia bacterium]